MTTIACSLSAAALRVRLAEMAAVGRRLESVERSGRELTLTFPAELRDPLARIVAAESECCPFLEMNLAATTLVVRAPAGAEPVLDDLAAVFVPDQ